MHSREFAGGLGKPYIKHPGQCRRSEVHLSAKRHYDLHPGD